MTEGVYISELSQPTAIPGVATSIAMFVGRTASGAVGEPSTVTGMADFASQFGASSAALPLSLAVRDYFANGGGSAVVCRIQNAAAPGQPLTEGAWLAGVNALPEGLAFNIFCLVPDQPGEDVPETVVNAVTALCATRNAMAILSPPNAWQAAWTAGTLAQAVADSFTDLPLASRRAAAVYFPNLVVPDPQTAAPITVSAAGAAAGVWAATDVARGVWAAPAGIMAGLNGVIQLAATLNDTDNGLLNAAGIDAIRVFPNYGIVLWGARTLAGVETAMDDFGYISVRRLTDYIESSLQAGLTWTVFEPNGPQLWASLVLAADAFMNGLWQSGALFGDSASQAYQVTCDASTTTPADIEQGIVNLVIAFSPLKPAEFLVLTIQLLAAQAS